MTPGGERRGGPESKDGFEGRDLLVAGPKGRRTGRTSADALAGGH